MKMKIMLKGSQKNDYKKKLRLASLQNDAIAAVQAATETVTGRQRGGEQPN